MEEEAEKDSSIESKHEENERKKKGGDETVDDKTQKVAVETKKQDQNGAVDETKRNLEKEFATIEKKEVVDTKLQENQVKAENNSRLPQAEKEGEKREHKTGVNDTEDNQDTDNDTIWQGVYNVSDFDYSKVEEGQSLKDTEKVEVQNDKNNRKRLVKLLEKVTQIQEE